MENQHRHIKGYRELNQTEIDLMNEIKELGEKVGELIQKMEHMPHEPAPNAPDGSSQPNARWLSIGRTDLQKGFMALVRSVANRHRFNQQPQEQIVMKVKLQAVRGAFLNLFEAKTVGGEGEPRFSGAFVIEPGSLNAKALAAAVETVAKEKWKEKAKVILEKLRGEGRVCYKQSPLTNSDGEVYEGFEGKHVVNASNKARPLILDRDKTPLTAADGKPYSGSYMNVSLDLWAQDNQYGKRINATLKGVQFVKDGDAFGGGAPASPDEFDDLGVEEEEESLV